MATPNFSGGMPRQGILSLAIKDKGALYNAYMPFVRGGGLFVPTAKKYNLGDEVFILLTLMDDKDRLPIRHHRFPAGGHGQLDVFGQSQRVSLAEAEGAGAKIDKHLFWPGCGDSRGARQTQPHGDLAGQRIQAFGPVVSGDPRCGDGRDDGHDRQHHQHFDQSESGRCI
jgi:type IV pilus assembly protein PilZ